MGDVHTYFRSGNLIHQSQQTQITGDISWISKDSAPKLPARQRLCYLEANNEDAPDKSRVIGFLTQNIYSHELRRTEVLDIRDVRDTLIPPSNLAHL